MIFIARISKYEEWEKEGNLNDKLLQVEAWTRDGLTDKQVANNLGISETVFYEYKEKYPEFAKSLKKGKEVVDIEVENALYKKAMGYNASIKKAFKIKETIYENGKKIKETEKIEYAEEEMHIPADTTAQIFWLKNRRKDRWRDKVEYETNSDDLAKVKELLSKIEDGAKNE